MHVPGPTNYGPHTCFIHMAQQLSFAEERTDALSPTTPPCSCHPQTTCTKATQVPLRWRHHHVYAVYHILSLPPALTPPPQATIHLTSTGCTPLYVITQSLCPLLAALTLSGPSPVHPKLSWFVPQLSMSFRSLAFSSSSSAHFQTLQIGLWPTWWPGLSAYFSFSLMDSHMKLICSYYLSLLDTLNSPCLHFDLWPSTLTSASCSQLSDSIPDSHIVADTVGTPQLDLWVLPLCQVCSLSSIFHVYAIELRITTVSGMFPVISFPCICYRTENYHCVSVSVTSVWLAPVLENLCIQVASSRVALTEDQALHRWSHTHRNLKIMSYQLPNEYWEFLVKTVHSYSHSLKANMNNCSNSRNWMPFSKPESQTHAMTLPMWLQLQHWQWHRLSQGTPRPAYPSRPCTTWSKAPRLPILNHLMGIRTKLKSL